MTAPPRPAHPALAAWAALRASGAARGALVTLVRADGGAARSLGTRFALADDGRTFGSVTIGGCADGRALDAARDALASGESRRVRVPLSEEDALALGLGCAGDVELLVDPVDLRGGDPTADALDGAVRAVADGASVSLAAPLDGAAWSVLAESDGGTGVREVSGRECFVERLVPVRTVLVVGATDVAAALCDLAAVLGWRTVLVDGRDDVLAQPRFASATERVPAIAAEAVAARVRATDPPAVVVVAHDYRLERPVLGEALRSGAPYVGMLGSRKRGAATRALLQEDGLSADQVARLRTPIGLAIGAEGPAEIAVSIVAELVQLWRGASPARTPP